MITAVALGAVLFQVGILAVLLEAFRRRNVAAVVNALVALAASVLPVALEFAVRFTVSGGFRLGPELTLWIAVAGCLHSFGMLGPYDSVWWWDYLTHAVSAALVTALLYGGLVAVGRNSTALDLSPAVLGGLAVVLTFVLGLYWELIELVAREVGDRYDVEPVLVNYGWRDTAMDLVVDVVAALVVILVDVRTFVPVADTFPGATTALLLGSVTLVAVSSVPMALIVYHGADSP